MLSLSTSVTHVAVDASSVKVATFDWNPESKQSMMEILTASVCHLNFTRSIASLSLRISDSTVLVLIVFVFVCVCVFLSLKEAFGHSI